MKIAVKGDRIKIEKTGFMRLCFYNSSIALVCLFLVAERIGNEIIVYSSLVFLVLLQMFLLYTNDEFLKITEIRQLFLIYLFFAIFMDAAFIGGGFVNLIAVREKLFFLLFIYYFNAGALFLIVTIRKAKTMKKIREFSFRAFMRDWGILTGIICIFAIWGLVCFNSSMRVDPWFYYKGLVNSASWDFSPMTFTQLKVCGHYCYGFSFWMLIGVFLIPYNAVGVLLCEILMGLITIFCVWRILKKLCHNQWLTDIGTAVFAFSPAFGGIIGELGTDFALTCFFIWMFYCYLYDLPILQTAVGVFLCFSKETALFPYAGFVFGLLISEASKYFHSKDLSKHRFVSIIIRRVLLSCVPGMIWILHIICNNFTFWGSKDTLSFELPERRINTFELDGEYIKFQLENLFVLHFSWLILLIVVVVAMAVFVRKQKKSFNRDILLLITSNVGFLFVEIGYITYVHYRYIQLNMFFLVCYLLIALSKLDMRRIAYVLSTLILVLLFVENYYIADPLTKLLYPKVDLGDIEAVSTWKISSNSNMELFSDSKGFSDSLMRNGMSNNRQYVYLGKILNIALNDIEYNNKIGLLMPFTFGENSYGNVFGKANAEEINWICYDSKRHILMLNNIYPSYLSKEYMVPFNFYWVKDLTTFPDMGGMKYQDLYYIAYPFCEEDNQVFRDNHEILEIKEYSLMGWRLQLYKVAQ